MADSTALMEAKEMTWQVVNDGVMGGRSQGAYQVTSDAVIFEGVTNTNGGGFSSIRSTTVPPNLAAASGIALKVRGDGRQYILRLEANGTAYWARFETAKGQWLTPQVAYPAFRPRWRGQWLTGPALEPDKIQGIGIMIYDQLDGPFRLEVKSIGSYVAQPASVGSN